MTYHKIALVTGSARRIGRSIALSLAQHGWDIAVHYRFSKNEALATAKDIRQIGRRSILLHCDLTNEKAVNQLLQQVEDSLGKPSCLVNNASVFEHDSIADFSAQSLEFHMRTNLTAPILLSRALHAMTPEGSQSVVINLLDQKLDNLNPSFLSYTLSKAALNTATTLLAQELAPKLRVVGIAPGITLVSGEQTEQDFQIAHKNTPLGRSSTPEDIASAVRFILDSPAITGTTIMVDGGQHLIPLSQDVMFIAKMSAQNNA